MGTNLIGNPDRPTGPLRRAFGRARQLLSDHFEGWKERRELVRSMEERSAHVSVSGDPPSRHAIRNLSILLGHEETYIRGKAARTLKSICVRGYRIDEAIPALLETLKDDSVWVRLDAAEALLALSSRASFPNIYDMLQGINRLSYSNFLQEEMAENPGTARSTIEAMLSILAAVQDATTITSFGRARLEHLLRSAEPRDVRVIMNDE